MAFAFRIVIGILLGLIVCGEASAEIMGFRAGMNRVVADNFHGHASDHFGHHTGGLIALSVAIPLTADHSWYLRPELQYKVSYWDDEHRLAPGYGWAAIPYKSIFQTNEIVLAPFVEYRIPEGWAVSFVQVGGEISYYRNVFPSDHRQYTASQWRDIGVGLNLGGGFLFPLVRHELVLDFRFHLDLRNHFPDSISKAVHGGRRFNEIHVLLGINFLE